MNETEKNTYDYDTDPMHAVIFNPGMTLKDIEKTVILSMLARHDNNKTHTARTLGIGIRTLQRKIKKYRMVC